METQKRRLIKRYANRKLYDTAQASYITLVDLFEYVKNDIPVRIINNVNAEDITASVLLSALVEQEKTINDLSVSDTLIMLTKYLNGGIK